MRLPVRPNAHRSLTRSCEDTAVQSVPLRTVFLFLGVPMAFAWIFGTSPWLLLAACGAWFCLMAWGARGGHRRGPARRYAPAVAYLLFLVFGLPVALASVVAKTWHAIAIAYGLWFALLGLWIAQGLLSRGVRNSEAVGWPMIGALFLTMAVVPILTLLLRLAGVA